MASEFVYVLAAGLAILVVGGVLAGYANQEADTPVEGEKIFSTDIGAVGEVQSTSRTPENLDSKDFTVRHENPNRTVEEIGKVHVGSNVLGSTVEVATFKARQPRRVYLKFVPSKTSSPGSLVIEVNGERINVPDYTAGEQVVVSSSNVRKGANTVRITAEKPGLSFWRMPAYTLQNFRIVVNDATHSRVFQPFRVYDYEVEGFDTGEIRFSVTEDVVADEPLHISINGNTVFERTVIKRALPYTVQFSKVGTDLRPGENVLSLSTSGDSVYRLENLDLTLYYYAGSERRTVTETFRLSDSEYRRIGESNGVVRFEVEKINLANPVTISLPGKDFTVSPTMGNNTVRFGQSAVEKGENTLKISTDGSYRISDFTISAE